MHQRPQIAELFCMAAINLKENTRGHNVHIRALVSDEESRQLCKRYGIGITTTVASPLGRKMNTGIEAILDYDFDYLLKIDDDDVVHPDLLNIYSPYMQARIHYFGVKQIYVLCSQTRQALYWKYKYNTAKLFGPGKMLSRQCLVNTGYKIGVKALRNIQHHGITIKQGAYAFLPAYQAKYLHAMEYAEIVTGAQFKLYKDEQTKSLDYESEMNLVFNGYPPVEIETDKPLITDVKSGTNIWSYNNLTQYGTPVTFEEATAFWTTEMLQYFNTLSNNQNPTT